MEFLFRLAKRAKPSRTTTSDQPSFQPPQLWRTRYAALSVKVTTILILIFSRGFFHLNRAISACRSNHPGNRNAERGRINAPRRTTIRNTDRPKICSFNSPLCQLLPARCVEVDLRGDRQGQQKSRYESPASVSDSFCLPRMAHCGTQHTQGME